MVKQNRSGRCVHCLKHSDNLTWDHVPPRAWYPDDSPKDLPKWKVPCCQECNNRLSRIEKDLLIKFGMGISPRNEKAAGIVDKTLRSIHPEKGKNNRDRAHRAATRRKIQSELIIGTIPKESILPFSIQPEEIPNNYPPVGILIPTDYYTAFVDKLIRGLSYALDGIYIEPEYTIDNLILHDNAAADIKNLLQKAGTAFQCGPGIFVMRALAEDDLQSSLWFIELWGKIKFYATVEKNHE